jgi:hypothetical protein
MLVEGQLEVARKPDLEQTETVSIISLEGGKYFRTGSLVTAFSTKAFHTGAATTPPVPGLPRLS